MKPIKDLLRNYNNDLEAYLKDNTPDESMLFEVVTTNNKSAYDLLMSKITVTKKEELFKTAVDHANIDFAFDIFKRFKEEFNNNQDLIYKNNDTQDDNARRFNNAEILEESNILPRHYHDIEYNNTKELFAAMLLNDSLRTANIEVLDYLLKNKNELNIKDNNIVQYFVEGYTMHQYDEDVTLHHEPQDFSKIIQLLLDNKVSFASDTQGYLLQIAGHNINIANYNRQEISKDLITNIIENGSNIEQYKARLDNQNNWLSDSQDSIFVHHYDLYQNYVYDISHKFDSRNSEKYLQCVTKLTGYVFKENTQQNSVDNYVVVEEIKPINLELATEKTSVKEEFNIHNSVNNEKGTPEVINNTSSGSALGKLINSLRERFTKSDNNKNNIKNN